MNKWILLLLIFPIGIFGVNPADIFYKTRCGNIQEAYTLYKKYKEEKGKDDLELIEKMAFIILDQGFRSHDNKEQFLATFGAGVARCPRLLYILEEGLKNESPQTQLASLYFLSDLHDDVADDLIKVAMGSNYLPIRLEAAKILDSKRTFDATDRVEGLMRQVDPLVYPLFPPLFALSADEHSTAFLKRCFTEKEGKIRHAALIACIDNKRDDLLPQIRTLATCGNMEEQEAALLALGILQDRKELPLLKSLTHSPYGNVKLAALFSLYKLGDMQTKECIEWLAKNGNLFAITALGSISGSEECLFELTKSSNLQVRINAGIALLQRRDERSLSTILEILLKDSRDLGLVENLSPGLVLTSWRVISSCSSRQDESMLESEMTLAIKEGLINAALDLRKDAFYQLASSILDSKDPELVPALISNLELYKDEATTEFLKKELQRVGAPLVRAYCNLALFRMKEEGPYGAFVKQWVRDLKHIDIINFRPLVPRTRGLTPYHMTPQETCRLFVESATALASEKDTESLEALLIAMSLGHPANRFALAGLIVRAIE